MYFTITSIKGECLNKTIDCGYYYISVYHIWTLLTESEYKNKIKHDGLK